jgi:hypothetical protein
MVKVRILPFASEAAPLPASNTLQKRSNPHWAWALFFISGERGIRTPGGVTLNGFQDRRIRPLCHLSAAKLAFGLELQKKL